MSKTIEEKIEAEIKRQFESIKCSQSAAYRQGIAYGRELGKREGFQMAVEFLARDYEFCSAHVDSLIYEGRRLGILKENEDE